MEGQELGLTFPVAEGISTISLAGGFWEGSQLQGFSRWPQVWEGREGRFFLRKL